MAWYYADDARHRQGPFSSDEIAGHVAAGRIGADTPLWRDGMAGWLPLRALQDALPFAAGTAAGDASHATPYAAPAADIAPERTFVAGGDVVPAGFWRRAAALCLDAVVLAFLYYLLVFVSVIAMLFAGQAFRLASNTTSIIIGVLGFALYPLVSAVYCAGFESSGHQATLGKLAVGIKVAGLDGRPLTLWHALGRWLATALNYLTLGGGYLMAVFAARGQGLHDKVARTQVVDRWAYTHHPQRQRRGAGLVAKVILALAATALALVLAVALFTLGVPAGVQLP